MKVSEVIKKLQELEKEWGDVECMIFMDDIDGTHLGLYDINEIDNTLEDEPIIYIAHREV